MKTKLDKYFRISQRGSTIGTELIGGATTFADVYKRQVYPGTPITARFWRSAPAKQCQWRRRIICTDRWRWMLPVRESMFW